MRLIDADALMETLGITSLDCDKCEWKSGYGSYCSRGADFTDACSAIEDAPTIATEPHWIPVTERLPEEYADVLVQFEYYRYGDYNCMYTTHGIGTYFKKYNSWMINHETGWRDLRVFAWMPLPEPYEEVDG